MSDIQILGNLQFAEAARARRHWIAAIFGIRQERYWRDALRRRMLASADLAALGSSTIVIALLDGGGNTALFAAFIPLWLLLAKLNGLYDHDHRTLRHLTVDELPKILVWALAGTALMTLIALAAGAGTWSDAERAHIWMLVTLLTFVFRGVARIAWRHVTPRERVLIVGSGALAAAARRKLDLFPDIHADAVDIAPEAEGLLDDRIEQIDRVILASEAVTEGDLERLLPLCRDRNVKLSVVPPARGMLGAATHLTTVGELPVLAYNTWDVSRSTIWMKRVLDVLGSCLAIVVLVPLFILVALAILVDSGWPLLFSHTRAGLRGRPFRIWKFRTMIQGAETRLEDVITIDELDDPMFKLRKDPRVTRIGRLLRRTSLDELPQLFNVLRGEMSLVGPRPEQLDLVARYEEQHRFRLAVKPGLTGPMQVYGRGELTFDERLAVEREYIANISILRDLRILLLTASAVWTGRGAF